MRLLPCFVGAPLLKHGEHRRWGGRGYQNISLTQNRIYHDLLCLSCVTPYIRVTLHLRTLVLLAYSSVRTILIFTNIAAVPMVIFSFFLTLLCIYIFYTKYIYLLYILVLRSCDGIHLSLHVFCLDFTDFRACHIYYVYYITIQYAVVLVLLQGFCSCTTTICIFIWEVNR